MATRSRWGASLKYKQTMPGDLVAKADGSVLIAMLTVESHGALRVVADVDDKSVSLLGSSQTMTTGDFLWRA